MLGGGQAELALGFQAWRSLRGRDVGSLGEAVLMEGRPQTKTRSRGSPPGPGGPWADEGWADDRAHGDMVDVLTRVDIKATCRGLGAKQTKGHGCPGLTADTLLITEPALQQWFSKCGSWASRIHIACRTVRNADSGAAL